VEFELMANKEHRSRAKTTTAPKESEAIKTFNAK
jgi:hypothetical protein